LCFIITNRSCGAIYRPWIFFVGMCIPYSL
jgi:hypothetical protein